MSAELSPGIDVVSASTLESDIRTSRENLSAHIAAVRMDSIASMSTQLPVVN
ncbi:MAG: hypothetical protein M3Q44_05020 [bacterium]|nr:hypothetical protein [bacterium]